MCGTLRTSADVVVSVIETFGMTSPVFMMTDVTARTGGVALESEIHRMLPSSPFCGRSELAFLSAKRRLMSFFFEALRPCCLDSLTYLICAIMSLGT